MIRVRVVARQGVVLDGSQMAEIGPAGGTIGRADGNTLVLSDPDRTVSRVHAQVLFRNGQYFVVDRGSNPIVCNGDSLGSGQERTLMGGERLMLGTFEVLVEFADTAGASAGLPDAPLAVAVKESDENDPFADLLRGLPGTPPMPAAPVTPVSTSKGRGPAALDVDPFADLLSPPPSPAADAHSDFFDLGMPGASASVRATPSIDELFGGPLPQGGAPGSDPLALFSLGEPLQPNTNTSADDLFASFGRQPAPTHNPRSDHVPVEQFGFTPPVMQQEPVASPSPRAPVAVAPPQVPHKAAQGTSDSDALLAAFLRGIGPLHQTPQELTPALMERIGVLLRCSTAGTLQLLTARQELKREVQVQVTMIGAQANNPLKFSPTADVALAHLLGPTIRGFMPAQDAMHDAYDDLRAHQFGVMVGMRAALEQLIARFAPDELERKIAAKSALDNVFSSPRKARLWDQFVAHYSAIAQEAEDDFHGLFGKAFAKAYDEQMAHLQDRK